MTAAVPRSKNRNYARGAAFERLVMMRLNLLGWTCFRSAGSRSPADVIALRRYYEPKGPTLPLLVQCKSGSARLTGADRDMFMAYARACGATPCEAFQVKGIGVRLVNLDTDEELG